MADGPHNAPVDFDLTGDNASATTTTLSADAPAQHTAPDARADSPPGQRSAREIIDAHLEQGRRGTVDDDLAENFDQDVIILTRWGTHRGHDGMRDLAAKLKDELPDMEFSYDLVLVEGDVGFLEWRGHGEDGTHVCDGADSYVVRDGRIVAQTIHYIPRDPDGRPQG